MAQLVSNSEQGEMMSEDTSVEQADDIAEQLQANGMYTSLTEGGNSTKWLACRGKVSLVHRSKDYTRHEFALNYYVSNGPSTALADLPTLIDLHLISPNCFTRSMATLNKFYKQLKNPVQFHYYCSFCYEHIGIQKQACCTNKHCLQDLTKKK